MLNTNMVGKDMRKGIQGHFLMLQGCMNLSKSINDFNNFAKGLYLTRNKAKSRERRP